MLKGEYNLGFQSSDEGERKKLAAENYTFVGIDVDATGNQTKNEVNLCAKKHTIFRFSICCSRSP